MTLRDSLFFLLGTILGALFVSTMEQLWAVPVAILVGATIMSLVCLISPTCAEDCQFRKLRDDESTPD
jgi:hypothetical protein